MNLFDVNSIMWTVPWFNYPMSWVEFLGTATGLWCVWLTAKEKVMSWPVGLANVIFFFVIFWQIRLYSDMLLQVYFFATGLFGWWKWTHPSSVESRESKSLKVMINGRDRNIQMVVLIGLSTLALGTLVKHIHTFLPSLFPAPAAYPYWDSLTAVMSVFAQWLLTKKRLESWILWMTADVIYVFLYHLKGVQLISIEYGVFFLIAAYGFWSWLRSWRKDGRMDFSRDCERRTAS